MILQALVQHYENLAKEDKVPKPGWCFAKVSFAIDLNKDGSIKAIISLKHEEERGKKSVWISSDMQVPEMVTRSSGVSANFLCDNAKYFLGIDIDGTSERTMECFQAAKNRHLSILKETDGVMAEAICKYFETWNPSNALHDPLVQERWEELNEGGNLIFTMSQLYAQDDASIRMAWENRKENLQEETKGICLVTGEKTEIARIHRGIKGVPGAQSSGAALVSFNAPAFESYGKEQSYNAPVGKYAEFAYTTALNYLLNQKKYTFQLGDSLVVFWAESAKQEYQKMFFLSLDPQPDNQEQLKKVFGNLRKNIWVDTEDVKIDPEQKFYILCLAPNAARLSVRCFYQNSFGNIMKNIEKHYASSFDPAFKTNEDEAWIFGLFYYNPKDKSSIVETRAGIGTSVNMATGLGKGLTIFSIIAMLSIPFISIFMIMEEFTPIHLVIKDDTLYCEHIFENYAIDTDTISNVSLVDELPSMVKSNGTAMDNLLKGKFHVRNQGNYELFLNPQHKYYINFSADDKNYYVNGFDDKETLEIYSELTD